MAATVAPSARAPAGALAAAALASRKADPDIRGRMLVTGKCSAKLAFPAPARLPNTPAPLGQLIPGGLCSQPAAYATLAPPTEVPVSSSCSGAMYADELVPEPSFLEQLVSTVLGAQAAISSSASSDLADGIGSCLSTTTTMPTPAVPSLPDVADTTGTTGSAGCMEVPWELVQPRRSLRRMAFTPPALKTRPCRSLPSAVACRRAPDMRSAPPAWLRDRCFRCLSRGHHARFCRNPIRCTNCLHSGHVARFCHDKPSTDQSAPIRCAPSPPPPPPAPGYFKAPPPCIDDATLTRVSLQHVLLEEAELLRTELRDYLVRVGSVLARAEDALEKLQVTSVVSLLSEFQVGSIDEGDECFFGDLSPRALHATPAVPESAVITEVVAPVVHIMPELHDLCGESSMVIPLEPLAVAMTPSPPPSESSQSSAFVDIGGLVASVTLPPVAIGHVVSLSDEVDEIGVLTPNSEALFAKEFYDLLVDLEAASSGYGKEIACVLTGKASESVIRKVEKSLRRKRKKLGVARKDSAVAR